MVQTAEYCLLGINWWPLCMPRSDWASWLQAVGSLVAIGAAFVVGNIQIRAARVQRKEELISRVRTVAAMLATAINATNVIRADFDRLALPPDRTQADFWLESARQLASLDPFLLPSADLVYLIVSLPTQLHAVHDAYIAFERMISMGPQRGMSEQFGKQLTTTIEMLSQARDACEQFVAAQSK